jgi:PadR family transcriptional regulator PadR
VPPGRSSAAQVNSSRKLTDIGKIRVVVDSMRVTGPLLDVLEEFLDAFAHGQELHGWEIMKRTKRSGPTVYGVLERLEDRGWIVGSWEEQPADANTPRRRYYRLTPNGKAFAEQTIIQRRSQPYRRPRLQFELVVGLLRAAPVGGAR